MFLFLNIVQDLRVALLVFGPIEAKKHNLIWFIENIACTTIQVEGHVSLTLQFASDDFACLKINNLSMIDNFKKLLVVCKENSHRSTKIHFEKSLRIHNELSGRRHTRKPSLR